MTPKIAIIGSGPTALMTASRILQLVPSAQLFLFEKRPSLGRKILVAGSSGLNITHSFQSDSNFAQFASHYQGFDLPFWQALFKNFGPTDWIRFIEVTLGIETFLGTSSRYFIKDKKSSHFLKKWTDFLSHKNCTVFNDHELIDFKITTSNPRPIELTFQHHTVTNEFFDAAVFCLGGASWEDETPKWSELFKNKNLKIKPFAPSNVGYEIDWHPQFLKECEGKPLKKVLLTTKKGSKLGEMVITKYGLEGTPVYFCGTPGKATLDLKPDLTENEILEKLKQCKENLSPIRRLEKTLKLSTAMQSLIFFHSDLKQKPLPELAFLIKNFELTLIQPRPLLEAISSKGGLALDEIDQNFELKKFPRIYCGGEMLDWDAPTGGFLIQACVSQGAAIADAISRHAFSK